MRDLIDAFATRYSNPETAKSYRRDVTELFRYTERLNPADITEGDIVAWCTQARRDGRHASNNRIRCRLVACRSFFRWATRHGHVAADPTLGLTGFDSPLRTYRTTYGRTQATHPGRWLTYEEAYEVLIGACTDGSVVGMRDELILRCGLLALRASEIAGLTVGSVDLTDTPPALRFVGKGSKPGFVKMGPAMTNLVRRYLAAYEQGIGRPLRPDDPLICFNRRGTHRNLPSAMRWGHAAAPKTRYRSIRHVVTLRATQAGIGHIAPHDLRRTAAGILHRTKDASGAHHFNLRDIQDQLRHADPNITVRCYLDPMTTDAQDRAADVLD